MEHLEYTYTFGMGDPELDGRLDDNDVGVLSLAADGDAYAVPVAYDYVDGDLYFRLSAGPDSRKIEYIEETEDACFVVYDCDGEDSWSVLVEGPIERVGDAEIESVDVAALNEAYPPLRVFDEEVSDLELRVYVLRVLQATGRRTEPA